MTQKNKQAWPTKDAMDQIYELNLWGGNRVDFYSGAGSHDYQIVKPYLDGVISFLDKHNRALTVCDFGCGDFNIGKELVKYTRKYVGIDIVKNLVERNKVRYQVRNLEFSCLDIAKDELPKGDCVILRQVLQHLSNAEIQNIVSKLVNYKYVILTEHVPIGDFIPNLDIISGQGIRLKKGSGVDVLESPFCLKIKNKTVIGDVILEGGKGRIVTVIYEVF